MKNWKNFPKRNEEKKRKNHLKQTPFLLAHNRILSLEYKCGAAKQLKEELNVKKTGFVKITLKSNKGKSSLSRNILHNFPH
jgi:hypothetical protein